MRAPFRLEPMTATETELSDGWREEIEEGIAAKRLKRVGDGRQARADLPTAAEERDEDR